MLTPEERRQRIRDTKRRWMERNPEKMQLCRSRWRERNLDRILIKRRERVERITGRKVIPRSSISSEEKLRKARIRSYRWYHAHKHEIKNKVLERSARWYRKNRHKIKLSPEQRRRRLEWQKEWRKKNPERRRAYELKQRQNIQRVIKQRLSTRVTAVLRRRNIRKSSKTIELIGCTWRFLKYHIENQFDLGMSWSNRHMWHIDHIRPCASFDLTDKQQQRECFHYSNLRPLWAYENMKKHAKWKEAA